MWGEAGVRSIACFGALIFFHLIVISNVMCVGGDGGLVWVRWDASCKSDTCTFIGHMHLRFADLPFGWQWLSNTYIGALIASLDKEIYN